jgi:hypothetical protein
VGSSSSFHFLSGLIQLLQPARLDQPLPADEAENDSDASEEDADGDADRPRPRWEEGLER